MFIKSECSDVESAGPDLDQGLVSTSQLRIKSHRVLKWLVSTGFFQT